MNDLEELENEVKELEKLLSENSENSENSEHLITPHEYIETMKKTSLKEFIKYVNMEAFASAKLGLTYFTIEKVKVPCIEFLEIFKTDYLVDIEYSMYIIKLKPETTCILRTDVMNTYKN